MIHNIEDQYISVMRSIMKDGDKRKDRTGTGTRSIFGVTLRHDYERGFPLLTTKKMHAKSIIYELLWFIRGDTNIKFLQDNGVRIWNEWASNEGELGPVYGKQLRDCGGVDQLTNVIESIKINPFSRRHIISLWHPPDIDKMALPCCHGLVVQFNVRDNGGEYKIDLSTYQRSADWFLGVPFNIASYSFLLYMICEVLGEKYKPGKLIYNFGDAHVYDNHRDQCYKQIENSEIRIFGCPKLSFKRSIFSINDFEYEDFVIENYDSWSTIKAKVSV